MELEKPNLNRMWRTYVKLGSPQQLSQNIRSKLGPTFSSLVSSKKIKWYCFLIHDRKEEGDPTLYFHIRFEPKDGIDDKAHVNEILPDYCEKDKTARCKEVGDDISKIAGIDESLLKNGVEDAWRILGEQSEWLINMVNSHKENVEIPVPQFVQFMHFYFNMVGLSGQSVFFFGPIIQF